MSKQNSTAPADGERRAQIGYVGQYRAQACLLLRALQEGDMEWIRVVDPKAHKLDDFQIGRPGRIDAYQIKWSEHPKAITFKDIAGSGLLRELASGWSALKRDYAPGRLVAHLLTNNYASVSDRTVPKEQSSPSHFSGFLKQVWEPIKTGSLPADQLPKAWASAWENFSESTGLNGDEFTDFTSDFELDIDYRTDAAPYSHGKQAAKLEDDIAELAGFFSRIIASPERIGLLTRDELLRRLGWTDRYEFRNIHKFPVNRAIYEPLEETAEELKTALEKHKQGYVCLLGSPGSGKSTLLTEMLSTGTERVIRYYAFIPDMGPITRRGESGNFLHDITLSLSKAGFRPDYDLARADSQELSEAFHQQIQQAGAHFGKTQCRTLILIDGLDHVKREQAKFITRELFGDFPLPSQIPEGVVFVLGTQTLDPLPSRIKSHLESEPYRVLSTRPLTSLAVGKILVRAELQDLSPRQKRRVFDHSAGHPLALNFIVNLLVSRPDEIEEILDSVPEFSGDIDDSYRAYWDDLVTSDNALWNLMALIARVRHQFHLRWVKKWADPSAFLTLATKLNHFFTCEEERWSFFHNSFRQFVIKMTSQLTQDENKDYHLQLANICEEYPGSWSSERLFHLAEARDHEQVLKNATQEFFRKQFFDSRPANMILQDIHLARRSLRHVNDPVAAVRLSLASTEVRRRDEGLNESTSDYGGHNLLLATGHLDEAVAQVRRGMTLLVSEQTAIRWCRDFLAMGHFSEAKRVFSLIDPISGAKGSLGFHPQKDQQDLWVEWADVALDQRSGFLSLARVLEVFSSFKFIAKEERQLGRDKTPSELRNEVITRIGLNLIYNGRYEGLPKIESSLDQEEKSYSACIHQLEMAKAEQAFDNGDSQSSRMILSAELLRVKNVNLSLQRGSVFDAAELCVKLGMLDEARNLMKNIEKPKTPRNAGVDGRSFVPLFRHYRLLHTFEDVSGQVRKKAKSEGGSPGSLALFDRHLNDLAWISSQAWLGNTLSPDMLEPFVCPFLEFYESAEIERVDGDSTLEIKYARIN